MKRQIIYLVIGMLCMAAVACGTTIGDAPDLSTSGPIIGNERLPASRGDGKAYSVSLDDIRAFYSIAPTLTGFVTLPTTTTIGEVSSAEILYLNGLSGSIQELLNLKQDIFKYDSNSNTQILHDSGSWKVLTSPMAATPSYISVHESSGIWLNSASTVKITGALNKTTFDTAPASATATGTTGDIRIVADAIYVCTATNTWKRTPLSTW